MDHLLIFLIAIAYPAYATIIWFLRERIRLEAGKPNAVVHFYRNNIIELWLLTLVILTWWFRKERTMAEVGLGLPGGWTFWIGVAVYASITFFLIRQIKTIRDSAKARAQLKKQLTRNIQLIVPRTGIERSYAILTSLTAGICEEILYRAFLMWYLMNWLPGIAALAISAFIFGIAHIYQGISGAIKALLAGGIFGLAYLLTGSLWIPIALHATIDITSLLSSSVALILEDYKTD